VPLVTKAAPVHLALALALAAAVAACQAKAAGPPPAPPPVEIDVLTLAPSEVRETGEYLGSLLSRDSVNVLPEVAGYVRKILVEPGQRVEAKAPLVEIDARVESAALESASAQADSARTALALAIQTRDRTQSLFKEGVISAEELERKNADVASSEAALRAATAQVSQRRVQVQNHVIRAAVPGLVADVRVRLGDYVTATTPITSISAADALELSIAVPAARARGLVLGAPIQILADDGSVLLESTAFFIAPEADPRTQLVVVKAAFQNTVGLRPSELVRARLVYATRQALQAPMLAIVRQSGQPFVFLLVEKEGKLVISQRPVTLGALGDRAYVVESGLAPGDRIAVSSMQMLREGSAVTIKAPPAAAPATPAPPASAPSAAPGKP
jgi:RND family efflux transporter MFP subunit